jgi:hypothetical protein
MLCMLRTASRLLLAMMLAGSACLFPLVSVAQAETTAPTSPNSSNSLFPRHAQLVYLSYTGQIRVDDPGVMPGEKAFTWNSGDYQGYTNIAVGDFNGDGLNEIVGTRANLVDVFNPRLPSGTLPVNVVQYQIDQPIRLLTTGDYNGDGRAEIAVHHAEVYNGNVDSLAVFASPNGTGWYQVWTDSYSVYWQAIDSGDVNGDGITDLVQISQNVQSIRVLNGLDWPTRIADTYGYAGLWMTFAVGNIFEHTGLYSKADLALLRTVDGGLPQLVLLRYDPNVDVKLGDVGSFGVWNPTFNSITLADVAGTGYKQPVMLRDPQIAGNTSLLLQNPAGASGVPPFERAAGVWSIVRSGDLDGDGRDEIVIMRSDRYRIYDDATTGYAALPDVEGSYNPSWIVVANVKGDGEAQGPTMSYGPKSLSFTQKFGDTPTIQSIVVTNTIPGTANIAYTAAPVEGTLWLRVNGTFGTTTGQTPGTVGVTYDYSLLTPSTYYGKVRIQATDPTVFNGVANIPVTLTLTDPGFIALPHTVSRTILTGTVAGPSSGNIQVMNPSGTVSWIAFATTVSQQAALASGAKVQVAGNNVSVGGSQVGIANWLSIGASSGFTPGSLSYTINPAGLGVGVHQAFITLVPSGNSAQSQTVAVTLSIANSIAYLPLTTRQ